MRLISSPQKRYKRWKRGKEKESKREIFWSRVYGRSGFNCSPAEPVNCRLTLPAEPRIMVCQWTTVTCDIDRNGTGLAFKPPRWDLIRMCTLYIQRYILEGRDASVFTGFHKHPRRSAGLSERQGVPECSLKPTFGSIHVIQSFPPLAWGQSRSALGISNSRSVLMKYTVQLYNMLPPPPRNIFLMFYFYGQIYFPIKRQNKHKTSWAMISQIRAVTELQVGSTQGHLHQFT